MKRPILIAAAIAALGGAVTAGAVLAQPAASQTDTILPGYWEYTNKIQFLVSNSSVEKRCVKPADIEKFFSGPSNRHYKCVYPTRVVGDGKAKFEGVCTDKRGRKAYVTAQGTYSPKAFTLNAKIKTSIIGLPVTPTGSISARYLGPTCPADAKS